MFHVICILSRSSSITEPRFIVMKYAWQILAERRLFATPLLPAHLFADNLTFCLEDIAEMLFWILWVCPLPPD